jgi:hypothetical protein
VNITATYTGDSGGLIHFVTRQQLQRANCRPPATASSTSPGVPRGRNHIVRLGDGLPTAAAASRKEPC